MKRRLACALLLLAAAPLLAQSRGDAALGQWRDGLANPNCEGAIPRWHRHYDRHVQRVLAGGDGPRLRLFAQVTSALRKAGLPTEYAIIPLLESDYDPRARSPWGQTGLWQFTAATARRHGLQVGDGNDQRLDPDASTRAAVAYLQRLHRMFGRDWRTTAMAYNAGDGALRRARRSRSHAGLSSITRAYPDKLHTVACLLLAAAKRSDAPGRQVRADGRTHVVAAGDTLSGLARRYRVPIARLMARNRLHPGSRLIPGQRLAIPDSPAR